MQNSNALTEQFGMQLTKLKNGRDTVSNERQEHLRGERDKKVSWWI